MDLTVSVGFQFSVFGYAILLGAVFGLLYEVFRILRAFLRWGPVAVAVQDILFWASCGGATFLFFLQFTEGAVRGYVLLGEGLGLLLYFLTLGRLISGATQKIISLCKRFVSFLKRVFVSPVAKKVRKVRKKGEEKRKIRAEIAKKRKAARKIHLKEHRMLLYNLIKHPSDKKGSKKPAKKPKRAKTAGNKNNGKGKKKKRRSQNK